MDRASKYLMHYACNLASASATEASALSAALSSYRSPSTSNGGRLCVPEAADPAARKRERLRVTEAQVKRLEDEIDRMNARLQPLRSFVLPGGTPAAAALHMARTVCRRAEREITALACRPGEQVSAPVLQYINRLSDLLFVASRAANDFGKCDVLWVPGQNR